MLVNVQVESSDTVLMGKCIFWSTQTLETLPFLSVICQRSQVRPLTSSTPTFLQVMPSSLAQGLLGSRRGLMLGVIPGRRPAISPALFSMYMCCSGIRMSLTWVLKSVIMMAPPRGPPCMSIRMWPLPKYILPVMSRVAVPPRVELNCISAEKGCGCTAVCAAAICMKSGIARVAMRTDWNRDFTRISLFNQLWEGQTKLPQGGQTVYDETHFQRKSHRAWDAIRILAPPFFAGANRTVVDTRPQLV